MKPTALDLFCGCGGVTEGLKQAGFVVLGAIDNDDLAIASYRANHKRVTVWKEDIRSVDPSELKRQLGLRKGELDLLAGCPPCQGFSTLRTLNGSRTIQDPRNELIFHFYRFVEILMPKVVMMENVPGLASDERFVTFLRQLRILGYKNNYQILNVANYGVPQRRRRLILLASRQGRIDFAPADQYVQTVREKIGKLNPAGESGDSLHSLSERRTERIKKLIALIPKDGGGRQDLPHGMQLNCHQRCDGFKDIYGRMHWDRVAPTITTGFFNPSKGRFIHPQEDRAITLREAALLQTFPAKYIISIKNGKAAAASLIGNALPPEFIRRHASEIRRFLLETKRKRK